MEYSILILFSHGKHGTIDKMETESKWIRFAFANSILLSLIEFGGEKKGNNNNNDDNRKMNSRILFVKERKKSVLLKWFSSKQTNGDICSIQIVC